MTKSEEIEILKKRIIELENRQSEKIISKLKNDIEFLGIQILALGNENSKIHLFEIWEKWGIER